MKKRQSLPKLRIRRETLLPLALGRAAGGTIFSLDDCTASCLCSVQAACRTVGTCPSIDDECHPSLEASCFC